MGWPWQRPAPVKMDPDAHLGMSYAEIFGQQQLHVQLVLIVAVHAVSHFLLRRYPGPFARPKNDDDKEAPKMKSLTYIAHYAPFLVTFACMAVYGCWLWLTNEELADPAFDRTWGAHEGAKALVTSMLAIQLYDVPVSLAIPELRVFTFVAHHCVVLTLAIAALRFQAFLYYGVYFMGVIECSTPLLALVDAFRDFPRLAELLPVVNELSRVGFAVAFFTVRIFGWVGVSVCFWIDALKLFKEGAPRHQLPLYIVLTWLVAHAGLTLLQWHWGIKIAKAAFAMALGDNSMREKEAQGA